MNKSLSGLHALIDQAKERIVDRLFERGRKAGSGEPLFFDKLNMRLIVHDELVAALAVYGAPQQEEHDDQEESERAFNAGYHCQWLKDEQRYIFDSAMRPGDPDGAYRAWLVTARPTDGNSAPVSSCPNGHGPMARNDGPLAPGASSGRAWKCAMCGIERMWPDDPQPAAHGGTAPHHVGMPIYDKERQVVYCPGCKATMYDVVPAVLRMRVDDDDVACCGGGSQ